MKALLALAALTSFLGLSAAAPAPAPQIPSGPNTVRATTRSQYEVWTGAIQYDTGVGKIFKNGVTSDITTLLTFEFPAAAAGSTCEFHFYLDGTATLGGSGLFDVFTSLAPATADTTSWPPGNQRDQNVARLSAANPGEAAYVAGFPNTIQSFPCPNGTYAIELVGVYDVDDIEWSGTGSGSYFVY